MGKTVFDEKKGEFVRDAYMNGYNPIDISRAIGSAPDTVRRYLIKHDIKRPPLEHKKLTVITKDDVNWALEMWNLGYSKRVIAEAMGITFGQLQCRTSKYWKDKEELIYK